MSTIKEFFVYILQGLDKFDFVKFINNLIAYFKKLLGKEDPSAPAGTTAAAK